MELPSLATELRKLLLWLTLAYFSRNSFKKRLIGLVVALKNARKWAWFYPKVGVASKLSRARDTIQNPLQEVLDPQTRVLCGFR